MTTALTSLSSSAAGSDEIKRCIRSWRDAGLEVVAFNDPTEIPALREQYDVDFVPVADTTANVFGRHFVPVTTIVRWAAERDVTGLLINSDIELDLARWELERLQLLAGAGLCYLVRYNHDGDRAHAQRDESGIDAFLFRGRDAPKLPDSFLSLGQPFWDYWLPTLFTQVYCADFPAAFHRRHANQWSWDTWHACAAEFARVTGEDAPTATHQDCHTLSSRVRARIADATIPLAHRPQPIREWVESAFAGGEPKIVLELGAHRGTDTAWLAALPGVTVHAFEPDPRNVPPPRANVTLHRAAVSDRDGRGSLILSREGWGGEWTYSSSLRRPKNHLRRFPVTFGGSVDVEVVALDTFYRRHELGLVDFVWADVQGAEGDLVRGGRQALRNTRYLYTEYSDDELYEGQATLAEILALLPDFRVRELWAEDVLLENLRLAA